MHSPFLNSVSHLHSSSLDLFLIHSFKCWKSTQVLDSFVHPLEEIKTSFTYIQFNSLIPSLSFVGILSELRLVEQLGEKSMSFLTFITGSTKSWQPAMTVDTTTAAYWLNWRVLLCSLWVLMSMVFASLLISKHECRRNSQGNEENRQSERPAGILYEDEVWRPCLRTIHPGWLLAFRVFAFLLLLLMLILNVAVDGGTIFYFYTQ